MKGQSLGTAAPHALPVVGSFQSQVSILRTSLDLLNSITRTARLQFSSGANISGSYRMKRLAGDLDQGDAGKSG